jgi:hypothetical protein
VSAIAASILTALAFAPASLAGSVFATATTSAPSAHIAPTLETPFVLAQLSPETGDGSENAAGNQNESVDSPDGNSSTQSDDRGNGDDAQNGDADNGDGDQNADNANNGDSANSDNGDSGDTQSDSGEADQSADNSAMR